LTGTATGGSYCYAFQITQRAKTQVYITGQSANTDFALTLVRNEEDGTLTSLGTSDSPGNATESLIALTQPGIYYWLMTANASDGSAFNFGSNVNVNADANELNDTLALATPVADHAVATGNMDSGSDLDYFRFVAQNGQDVILELGDAFGANEWVFELDNGGTWIPLSVNTYYTLSGLTAPTTVYVRVRANPSATVNPAHTYQLLLGGQVESSAGARAFTNENLIFINTNPFLTTQVHNQLFWSIVLYDSTGHPVPGAKANFNWQLLGVVHTVSAISDASGTASGQVNLGNCTGANTITQTAPNGQTWRTDFDAGAWNMTVDNTNNAGVGGPNFPSVTLGHICTQTFIPSP
jgi:hypothetical protein